MFRYLMPQSQRAAQPGNGVQTTIRSIRRIAFVLGRYANALYLGGALGLVGGLAGCATYHRLPLAGGPDLASSLNQLDTRLPPATPAAKPRRIDIQRPLPINDIGLLAVLNDPDLRAERGEMGAARAGLLQASTLPNPSVSLGFAALLGGPGSTPSYAASLSQDIATLVTYRARVSAARANVSAVDASLLWREWQVAQKARLLALDIAYTRRSIALTRRENDLLGDALQRTESALSAGNLTLTALAPIRAAKAAAEQALLSLTLRQLQQWQSLDALLGLAPSARFAIALPDPAPPPRFLAPLMARLPAIRPDLVALRLGYRASEASLRAAILGQFPALALGGTWGSDTSNVRSAGPSVTLELPIFNRNQGTISATRASRRLLHEQYIARLDRAAGTIRGLAARHRQLMADLPMARAAASAAASQARAARTAFAAGNLDQRSLTDYETTSLHRALQVTDLERMIGETRIALGVELGIGLPATRLHRGHPHEARVDRAATDRTL